MNIGRGLFGKEELLIHTINEHKIDILSVSECDLEDFNESKPFSIKGFKTFFPLKRIGTNTKRLLGTILVQILPKKGHHYSPKTP